MKLDKTQRKVCFTVSQEQHEKVSALPRSFNLSDRLRKCLDTILKSQSSDNLPGDGKGRHVPLPPTNKGDTK